MMESSSEELADREGLMRALREAQRLKDANALDASLQLLAKCVFVLVRTPPADVSATTSALFFLNRSEVYLKMNRFQESEDDCNIALSVSSRNSKAKVIRAAARHALGRCEAALADIESAVSEPLISDAVRGEADALRALIQGSVGSTGQGAAGMHTQDVDAKYVEPSSAAITRSIASASRLFCQGCFAESLNTLSISIVVIQKEGSLDVLDELQATLYANRAALYLFAQQWSEAERDCSSALLLNAKSTEARVQRAIARYKLGQLLDARQDAEQVFQQERAATVNASSLQWQVARQVLITLHLDCQRALPLETITGPSATQAVGKNTCDFEAKSSGTTVPEVIADGSSMGPSGYADPVGA